MTSYQLDHIAVAVTSLDQACRVYELVTGLEGSPVEEIPAQGVRVQFLGPLELIEPTGPETPVGRFLARRGAGLHHLAFRVKDLEAELDRLQQVGVGLIDHAPRPGARGHRVAFLNPKSTAGVLIELIESPDVSDDPPEA